MIKIKNHHFVDEKIKLIKRYSSDLQKVVQRLQLTMIQQKKKIEIFK